MSKPVQLGDGASARLSLKRSRGFRRGAGDRHGGLPTGKRHVTMRERQQEARVAGRGHRDIFAADMQWQKGSGEGIEYVRYLMDEADASSPLVILSRFEPGEVVEPHTHAANYFEYVIEGEQTVGKTLFRKGDIRIVKGGTGYGPITIGPEGCLVLIVFQEANGAMMVPKGTLREGEF